MINKAEDRFAFVVEQLSIVGLVVLVVTFFIYAFGVIDPSISLSELQTAWRLPAKDLLASQGISPGWGWLRELQHSDLLCLLGPVLLGMTIILAYIAMIPVLLDKGRRRYVFIILIELGILFFAMSGMIGVQG